MRRGQVATQLCCCTTYRPLVGQGATEYLVLLAVVLIIALVSIALLGFFPGTASDAQLNENLIYWKSASPLAVSEFKVTLDNPAYNTSLITYIKVTNNGANTITVTKLLNVVGGTVYETNSTRNPPSSVITPISVKLAPGESKTLVNWDTGGTDAYITMGYNGWYAYYALTFKQSCAANNAIVETTGNFGFEYTVNVEGQAVTKRQVGKPLVVRCAGVYAY